MRIIDLVDGKIVISAECLCISPFSEIWQSDKSKDKVNATNQIKYIWFFSDFESPYYTHPEEDRSSLIIKDVIKDDKFKIDDTINKAVEKYKALHVTASMRLLDAANSAIFKMEKYFKEIDYTRDDPDKVQKMIINLPKQTAAVNDAMKLCKEQSLSGVRVRGNADVGMFEG